MQRDTGYLEAHTVGKKLLILARMINACEDALICDLAEGYRVYDYRSLPPYRAAILACGLREDSRTKQQLSGRVYPPASELLLLLYDRVNWLRWAQTKDGRRGENYPESLYAECMGLKTEPESNVRAYDSAEDFEAAKRMILEGGETGG